MSNRLQDDTECIAAWRDFIGRFNALYESDLPAEVKKKEMLKIKEEASIKNALNYRQTDAVIARVNNYLNGTYGTSKKPSNFGHSKTS